jgi:hypothetical protein
MSLLFACSSQKTADVGSQDAEQKDNSVKTSQTAVAGTTGAYSIEITPVNVTRNSIIYLVSHGFNLSDAKIEWFVNGIPVSVADPVRLNTSETKKNDKVQARVMIQGREMLSNTVQIRNSLPGIIQAKILPEVFKPGDTLSVEASGSDSDGDEVTLTYEWTKNGQPAGNGKQIDVPLKRGDKVDVKIIPFDGEAYGTPLVLHREILNMPPMITENKRFHFDGKLYTYQINAADSDGDTLTYSLKSEPPGMTVDPSTGLVRWNVPANFTGKASFTVSVTDGHGGEVLQSLTLDLKAEQKK